MWIYIGNKNVTWLTKNYSEVENVWGTRIEKNRRTERKSWKGGLKPNNGKH